MRVRTAVSAAALAAAAALTLTACGGGSGDGNDKISGAPTTTAAPTATASPPKVKALTIDPAFKLPAGLNLTFDWTRPADPTKAAALTAAANFMQSMAYGVVKQSATTSGLGTYATGGAHTYATQYVQNHIDAEHTLTGTDLMYRPVVKVAANKGAAEVTFCEDQAKLYSKEIPTGKVNVTTPSDDDYTSYDIVVVKAQTRAQWWQAQSVNYKERAVECKQ
jgi:hypothetical protein